MGREFVVIAGLCALVGTGMQMREAIQEIRRKVDELRAYQAIEELRDEFTWRHPIKRRKQRHALRDLLAESPTEAQHWRAINHKLFAWVLLTIAALFAMVGAVMGA